MKITNREIPLMINNESVKECETLLLREPLHLVSVERNIAVLYNGDRSNYYVEIYLGTKVLEIDGNGVLGVFAWQQVINRILDVLENEEDKLNVLRVEEMVALNKLKKELREMLDK